MIAVNTSALMAIGLGEPFAAACAAAITGQDTILISDPTMSESLIVAMGRGIEREMRSLLDELALAAVPLTAERARAAAEAYRR